MADHGIAPTGIRATLDFETTEINPRKRKREPESDGPIPGEPVLNELLKPTR